MGEPYSKIESLKRQEAVVAFWCFVTLIIERPEVYLSRQGRIIHKIAEDGGESRAIADVAKEVVQPSWVVGQLLKTEGLSNDVDIIEEGNEKHLRFNKEVIGEAKNLAFGIMRKKK